jgi:hypothetical protein
MLLLYSLADSVWLARKILRETTMKSTFTRVYLLAGLIVLLLTGCEGTWQAGETTGPNVLHIVRTNPLPIPGHHLAPLNMVIHDATQIQSLYDAAHTLKKIPSGAIFHCPVDFGLAYHLDFLRANTLIQHMDLNAMGCQFLTIAPHDTRYTTPSFRALLAKILNLPSLLPPDKP